MDFSWKLDPRVWLVVTPFQLSLCNTDVVIPIVFISGAFDKLPMGEGGVYMSIFLVVIICFVFN